MRECLCVQYKVAHVILHNERTLDLVIMLPEPEVERALGPPPPVTPEWECACGGMFGDD